MEALRRTSRVVSMGNDFMGALKAEKNSRGLQADASNRLGAVAKVNNIYRSSPRAGHRN